MMARLPRPVLLAAAIGVAYCGLVVLAYAIGPERASGCSGGGHGRIIAANGDPSSFRGLAATRPPRGVELYRDNGPRDPFHLVALNVGQMTCGAGASSAVVSGKGTVDGAKLQYRAEFRLATDGSGRDTYRLVLSNGYDSGAQRIRHADVTVQSGASVRRHHDADAAQNQIGSQDGG